jgi:hypothetical protein
VNGAKARSRFLIVWLWCWVSASPGGISNSIKCLEPRSPIDDDGPSVFSDLH